MATYVCWRGLHIMCRTVHYATCSFNVLQVSRALPATVGGIVHGKFARQKEDAMLCCLLEKPMFLWLSSLLTHVFACDATPM
jgi:hypothetical protein